MSVRVEDGRVLASGRFTGDDETHERIVVERVVPGPAAPAVRLDPADNDGPLVVKYNTGQGQKGITVEDAGDGTDYFNVDENGDVNINQLLNVDAVDVKHVDVTTELRVNDLQDNLTRVVPDKEDDHEERQTKDTVVLRDHNTGTCKIANLRVTARRLPLDQTYLDQDGLAPRASAQSF